MDYDKIFEQDIERKFFYTDYPGKKIVAGKYCAWNKKQSRARLRRGEHRSPACKKYQKVKI